MRKVSGRVTAKRIGAAAAVVAAAALALGACGRSGGDGGWAKEDPTPREGYVHVPGGRLWYRIVGSGKGTPLLTLHGGPGAPHYYLKPLAGVGADRPVIFFDQLGAGRSDHVTDTTLFTIPKYVERLDSLRHRLGLREVHLYGQSWGTILGTEYVLAHPEGVRSLILSSPTLSIPAWAADADTMVSQLPDSLQRAIREGERTRSFDSPAYRAATEAYYLRHLARKTPWSADIDSAFSQLDTVQYYLLNGHSEFTMDGRLRDYDITDSLGDLRLPVLYITGEYDEARVPTVRRYAAETPNAVLSITPGAGHLTMQDDSAHDVATIRAFLNGVDAGRAGGPGMAGARSGGAGEAAAGTGTAGSRADAGSAANAAASVGRWTVPDSSACEGVTFAWSLPPARAGELAGPGLEPVRAAGGRTPISVFAVACPGGMVDGRATGPSSLAAVIVPVRAPPDSAGAPAAQGTAAVPEVIAPAGSPVAALFARSGFRVTDGTVEVGSGPAADGRRITVTITTGEGRIEGSARVAAGPGHEVAQRSALLGPPVPGSGSGASAAPSFAGREESVRRMATSLDVSADGVTWLGRWRLGGPPSAAWVDSSFIWDFTFRRP
ncbi:MAG TPA: proline iminopeptidase-family hydrolase [Gemmatimonadota bacterium]|nr:proline iminopeptidase-family hydrolase [Gemmatimonadota bacterium]